MPSDVPIKQPKTSKPTNQADIQKRLSKAFAKASQDADGWVTLSALGQTGFQANTYGYGGLKKLLQSMPNLVELRIKGSVNSARLKK